MTLDSRHIRAGRALIDATQEEMAKAAGLSLATLNNIERNVAHPRAKTYDKIRQALADAGVKITAEENLQRVDFRAEEYLEEEIGSPLRETLARLVRKNNLLDVQRAVFFCKENDRIRVAVYLEGALRHLIYQGTILDTQHRIGLAELAVFAITCRKELKNNVFFADAPLPEALSSSEENEFSRIARASTHSDLARFLDQFPDSEKSISAAQESPEHPLSHVMRVFG